MPVLPNVKSNFGISDYKLILDESTTTPDLIDQNIMYAKIMVKPARAIEFIAIDFVVASTGASFEIICFGDDVEKRFRTANISNQLTFFDFAKSPEATNGPYSVRLRALGLGLRNCFVFLNFKF